MTLSPHTATRGAAEAAVLGAYLADPKADERERVRRAVNAPGWSDWARSGRHW